MPRTNTRLCAILMLALVALPASFTAQTKDKDKEKDNAATLPAVIWRDPGHMASLNLVYGAGGKEDAPNPNGPFTFVKEDLQETSPKFDVQDDRGVEWRVKLGQEPQSENRSRRADTPKAREIQL